MFPFNTLENFPEATHLLGFARKKPRNTLLSKKRCPVCIGKMRLAYSGGGTNEVDVCDRCHVLWCDDTEYSAEGRPRFGKLSTPLPPVPSPLPASASEAPLLEVEDTEMDDVFHLLTRLPLEENEPAVLSKLLTIPLLLMACVAFSIFAKSSRFSLGFLALDPWRHYGLTWLTATFVHTDFLHLVTNGYFIWLYGDNVEDVIGSLQTLELFLLGSVGGHVAAMIFGPPQSIYYGASGAVLALAVFYTLSFPKSRFCYFFPLWVVWVARVRVPVFVVTATYIAIDLLAVDGQMRGIGNISHLSHLGGAAVGAFYWVIFRPKHFRASAQSAGSGPSGDR